MIQDDERGQVVAELLREFEEAASRRGIWEKQWEDVSRKVLPYYSTSFYSQGNTVPGARRDQEQYDTTANGALWKFAAAMESMLTPANGRWHKLRTTDPELMKIRDVALWFDAVNDALFNYRYSPNSGYQAQQHEGYVSQGAFGTSSLFIDEFSDPTDPGTKGLRYRNCHLGEVFYAVNHQGQVDKLFRRFKYTLRQIVQKWGEDSLPDMLRSRFREKPEAEEFIIHVVRPNSQFVAGRLDFRGKRFSSHYVLKDQRHLLSEGGYRCFPYAVARYITAPGELYGRSPAMNVLSNINVVNDQVKTVLKQGHRIVDPVLLAHDDGILNGFSLKPGAMNYGAVNADGRLLVHPLPTGNLAVGKELMDDQRLAINDAFLVTLFQILVETPQMTATEVLERAREKGALLSPTMGRFQSESIGPMIKREFDLLKYQQLLPPIPPVLIEAGAQYHVEYDAPLNRAMRADTAAGSMRTFQWVSEIVAQTQDPSPLDWFDVDAIVPELSDINGMPARFMRDPMAVAAIRAQRQETNQAQQVTQALPGMAQMTKAVAPQGIVPNAGQPGGPAQ